MLGYLRILWSYGRSNASKTPEESCLFLANQHLKCRVVKQLELYMCARIPIPLSLDKLHCIIIFMPCIHASHDHANSFAIVVRVASVVCCSDFLLTG
jgi:hypothetical protein